MRCTSQSSGTLPCSSKLVDALEVQAEGAVELVEVGFVLDQRQARQVVEVIERTADHLFCSLQQRQELLDADRDFGVLEREEKIDQHVSDPCCASL
jgi:hypothetical protein